jgi:hypothetical protein
MKGTGRGRPQQQVHFAAPPRHQAPIPSMAPAAGSEICRTFAQHGSCQFGDRCRFVHNAVGARGSHGQAAPAAPSTGGVCRTFAQTGMCQYGDRCRYSHDSPGPVRTFGVPQQVAASTARAGTVEPCRNFAQFGSCKMGDRCRYAHDAPTGHVGFQAQRAPASRSTEACRYFAQHGTCQWGDQCVFVHAPAAGMSDVSGWPTDAREAMPSRRSNQPCHFFAAKGFCNKGNSCPYSHGAPASGLPAGEIDMGGFAEFENDDSMYGGGSAPAGFSQMGVPRRRLAGHSAPGFGSNSGVSHGGGHAPSVANLFDTLGPQVAMPEPTASVAISEGIIAAPTISERDLAAFRAARFEYGCIPEVEPPVATASGGSILLVG